MKVVALILLLTAGPSLPPQSESLGRPCSPTQLNINTARGAQLLTVEGVTREVAYAIIEGRPYKSIQTLEEKLPKDVWAKIGAKFCFPSFPNAQTKREIQVISGNKIDSLLFERPLEEERKEPSPPVAPSPSVIPPL